MQNLCHSGVHANEQLTGNHQRHCGRTHDAPLVHLGVGFGRPQTGLGYLQVFDQFGHHLLDLRQLPGTQGTYHEVGQSQDKFALDHVLGHHLVSRVHVLTRFHGHVIAQVDISE